MTDRSPLTLVRAPLALCMTLLLSLAGCQTAAEPRGLPVPDDFALVLTLYSSDEPPDEPEPAQFVLLPDRWLHAARGPGVYHDYFPDRTLRLSPQQVGRIHQHVQQHALAELDQRIEPLPTPAPGAFELTIIARSTQHRFIVDADDAPELVELLAMLNAATIGELD